MSRILPLLFPTLITMLSIAIGVSFATLLKEGYGTEHFNKYFGALLMTVGGSMLTVACFPAFVFICAFTYSYTTAVFVPWVVDIRRRLGFDVATPRLNLKKRKRSYVRRNTVDFSEELDRRRPESPWETSSGMQGLPDENVFIAAPVLSNPMPGLENLPPATSWKNPRQAQIDEIARRTERYPGDLSASEFAELNPVPEDLTLAGVWKIERNLMDGRNTESSDISRST